jgi:O-Antigen ligase
VNLRFRLLNGTDRLLAALVATLIVGSTVAFGGHVWWAPPALAAVCLALVLACLLRMLLDGRMKVLRSPLTALWVLSLGLAAAQVVPLSPSASSALSPSSRAVYAVGVLPGRARDLDPSLELPEGPAIRSPVSLDRPATMRWMAAAAACLAVFWAASQYADRLGHLYVVWGSVLVAFFLNTALAVVQLACRSKGLLGWYFEPGRGPAWGPNANDLLTAPNAGVLRALGEPQAGHPAWAVLVPDRPYAIGTLMGGSGAYLALGSLVLPLALGLTLQLLAPRGSREPLSVRLGQSGRGGLVFLLFGLLVASAGIVGMLAGPACCVPFALGLLVAGFPAAWRTGLRGSAIGLTFLTLAALGGGVALGTVWSGSRTIPMPVEPVALGPATRVWTDALAIVHDFPVLGTGLGTFASVYPFYKGLDASPTTASSSLLQWWVEAGFVGLGLVVLGGLWCLSRLPGAVRKVGTADRALVFGLIGAAVGFTLFSAVHWTVELVSVALAASALGGTFNRWLAGGTDLFVERG